MLQRNNQSATFRSYPPPQPNILHLEGLAPRLKKGAGTLLSEMSFLTTTIATPTRRSLDDVCDNLSIVVLAVVALVAAATFRSYGLGWDDYTHAEYAELLIRLYASGFRDQAALSFANLYMYGGGFDVIAELMHRALHSDLFETRRLLGAVVGIAGLAVTWRVARRVGGPVAGLAALVLLALTPNYYGHMFMNPKDAPFAVAMMVAMLGSIRLVEDYPKPSATTVLLLGTGLGLAIGSRVLGGFAVVYLAAGLLPLIVADARAGGVTEAARRFVRMTYALVPGLVFGYLLMALMWPWSVLDPLNPFRAVAYFSHFFEKPWKEMFNGALVSVQDMPWSYLPTLFALRTPEIVTVLAFVGLAGAVAIQRRRNVPLTKRSILVMLALAATLPLMFAIVKRPALYNGIRHFLFVVPPMAVLAGLAFADILAWARRRHGRPMVLGVSAVVAAGLALPASEMVRLHPYQYTYFNHAAGTVRAADHLYMLDYWGLAFKQASEDLRTQLLERQEYPPEGRKWKVAVCGPQRPAQVGLGPEFTIGWDSVAADFAMTLGEFYCRGLNAPVLVEIKRDDVVYARVYDIRGSSISSLLSVPAP